MAQSWSGQTGGTHWMQRTLVRIIRHTDIRFIYGLMHLWLVWYVLVRPCERRGAYLFHRHRGRTPIKAALDVYRSFCHFGRAIVDRFAVYAGKSFDVQVDNRERYYGRVRSKAGFVMLFSHVGNTEMAGYFLSTPDKRMHILAYGGESPEVLSRRMQVLERNNIGIITMQKGDMSHIYRINEVLQHGDVLAVAADRRMGDTAVSCTFMGAEAQFPAGPFRICRAIKKTVLLTFVIKESYKTYHVYTKELDPDMNIADHYAQCLEQMALLYPYEWFNFFDFWGN